MPQRPEADDGGALAGAKSDVCLEWRTMMLKAVFSRRTEQ